MRFADARTEIQTASEPRPQSGIRLLRNRLPSPGRILAYGLLMGTLALATVAAGEAFVTSAAPKVDPSKFPGYDPICDTGSTAVTMRGFPDRTLVYYGKDATDPSQCFFRTRDLGGDVNTSGTLDPFLIGLDRAMEVPDAQMAALGTPPGQWVLETPVGYMTNIPESRRAQHLTRIRP